MITWMPRLTKEKREMLDSSSLCIMWHECFCAKKGGSFTAKETFFGGLSRKGLDKVNYSWLDRIKAELFSVLRPVTIVEKHNQTKS